MKLSLSGITFGPEECYYVYWWNWLPKHCGVPIHPDGTKCQLRYWGRKDMWYDIPHCSFGFWFFNITWSLPWSE